MAFGIDVYSIHFSDPFTGNFARALRATEDEFSEVEQTVKAIEQDCIGGNFNASALFDSLMSRYLQADLAAVQSAVNDIVDSALETKHIHEALEHGFCLEDFGFYPENFEEDEYWEDIQERQEVSLEATAEQARVGGSTAVARSSETSAAVAKKSRSRSDGDGDGDGDGKNKTNAQIFNDGPICLLATARRLAKEENGHHDPDPDDRIIADPYRKDSNYDYPAEYRYLRKAVLAHRLGYTLTPQQKRVAEEYLLLSVPYLARVIQAHFRRYSITNATGFVDDVIATLFRKLVKQHDFSRIRNINVHTILTAHFRSIDKLVQFCGATEAYSDKTALSHLKTDIVRGENEDEDYSDEERISNLRFHASGGQIRDLADDLIEREDLAKYALDDDSYIAIEGGTATIDSVLLFIARRFQDVSDIPNDALFRVVGVLREFSGYRQSQVISALESRANPKRKKDREKYAPVREISSAILSALGQQQDLGL